MSVKPTVRASHADLTSLLGDDTPTPAPEAASPTQEMPSRRTTGGRRRKEKKPLSSTDGRRQRGLGRHRQFNTNCTQAIHDAIDDAIERFDLTKAELFERAIWRYISALKDGDAE